ncbi:hypothetical protein TNCV_2703471 [Trichonephila clavipes]|nr:hypothetical protein TNCV_2703471 [Trichonephila clavipes]
MQSSGHGKTQYRSSSRLCRVSTISPAVCRLFLLACKTMYRSSAGMDPRGRQHALYYSDTPPLRLPEYLRMCYRTSLYLIS